MPPSTLSLRAAIEIAKQPRHERREDALTRILAVTKTTVGSMCLRWTGNRVVSKLLPEMDDIAQECRMVVLSKVVRNYDPARLEGKDEDAAASMFCGYVVRALTSHFLDVVRVQNRRPSTCQSGKAEDIFTMADDSRMVAGQDTPAPSSSNEPGGLDEREIIGSLRPALRDEDFDILYLRFDGYTPREIAALKGVSAKTVRERIRNHVAPVVAARLARMGYAVPTRVGLVV